MKVEKEGNKVEKGVRGDERLRKDYERVREVGKKEY